MKPPYSYRALISMALHEAAGNGLTLHGIYDYITKNFPYYCNSENEAWRNSIPTILSRNLCFMQLRGHESRYWVLNPNHESFFAKGNYRRLKYKRTAVNYQPTMAACYAGAGWFAAASYHLHCHHPYYPLTVHNNNAAAAALQSPATLTTQRTELPSAYGQMVAGSAYHSFMYLPRSAEPLRSSSSTTTSSSSVATGGSLPLITPHPPPVPFNLAYPRTAAAIGSCSSSSVATGGSLPLITPYLPPAPFNLAYPRTAAAIGSCSSSSVATGLIFHYCFCTCQISKCNVTISIAWRFYYPQEEKANNKTSTSLGPTRKGHHN